MCYVFKKLRALLRHLQLVLADPNNLKMEANIGEGEDKLDGDENANVNVEAKSEYRSGEEILASDVER